MRHAIAVCLQLFLFLSATSQDSVSDISPDFELSVISIDKLENTNTRVNERIQRSANKYIAALAKEELLIKTKIAARDTAAANEIICKQLSKLSKLSTELRDKKARITGYFRKIDSLQSIFKLQKLSSVNNGNSMKLNGLIDSYSKINSSMNSSQSILEQLKERQQFLKDQLQRFGLTKELDNYKKKLFYYKTQLQEYKNLINEPSKMEARALSFARNLPLFKKFFDKYSQFAQLFPAPGTNPDMPFQSGDLQTQNGLQQFLQDRFGNTPAVARNLNAGVANAQSQLAALKKIIRKSGDFTQGDDQMPDFKINDQKTKSFLQRLAYGTNFQSLKNNGLLPSTTNIGLSIAYRINSRSIVGFGGSYRVGWGRSLRHFSVSHEGIGFRNFVEWKMKGSFWLTGGAELNYLSGFKNLEILKNFTPWQRSALLGINKKVKLKKVQGSAQVLYDFLYSTHIPASQPISFRMGYQIN